MKLYWNLIQRDSLEIWVATEKPLKEGDNIFFCDTVGYIERQKDGTFSCYEGTSSRYLGNEPNKDYAMKLVVETAERCKAMTVRRRSID